MTGGREYASCRQLALLCLAMLSMHTVVAADDAKAWSSVTRIQGSFQITSESWIRETDDQYESLEVAKVHFTMVIDPEAELPNLRWQAESARIVGSIHTTSHNVVAGSYTADADFSGVAASMSEFSISLDTETGAWQILTPGFLNENYDVVHNYFGGDDPHTIIDEQNIVQSVVFDGVMSGKPGVTVGKVEIFIPVTDRPGRGNQTVGRLQFYPEFGEFELEVTIADYATWRPLASIQKPGIPGNHLLARATVKPKDGSKLPPPDMAEFKFRLLDTSREPGVALNWPLGAKDKDYDLRLATASMFAGTLGEKNQSLTVTEAQRDKANLPYAEAQLDSYDFGAKSELMVTATMTDGRELVGKMKIAGAEEDIVRLPRRLGPDWIAAVWREKNNVVKLAEDDDSEKVEGQEHDGDGYTLYEEYRGWVEAGRHIEGDPEAKDFFILNLIGADAEPGIELFEDLSKLRVHSKLRRSEMSQSTRLMNGNRFNAPQRVQQHGVWIKTMSRSDLGADGAMTVMLKSGVAGRPGTVKGIGILARDDSDSAFNKPFNMPVQDTVFAYDRAIAHELLHSVGVEHHGSGDYGRIVGYVSPRHPNNRLGRPYFGTKPEEPIELVDEAGHDVAAQQFETYLALRQMLEFGFLEQYIEEGRKFIADREGYDLRFKTPEAYANNELETHIFLMMHMQGVVGVEHGEHSGHQDCVMRYSFARFYEKKAGPTDALYLVTPGSERIGMEICLTPQGTGINAAGHKPQSRYGDATTSGGNSFGQICPNDAIPPRATK